MTKKHLFAAVVFIFLFLLGTSASGFDFGFAIVNTTGYELDPDFTFLQNDRVSLWMQTADGKPFSLFVQGSYTFDLDRYYLFDLDILRFQGQFLSLETTPFKFDFAAGRLAFKEYSGKLLNHRLDGIKLNFNVPFAVFSVAGGYAGLYQLPTSSIAMSKADFADFNDETVFFGPPRVVEMVSASFIELFLRQDITLSAVFQQDLHPAADLLQQGTTTYEAAKGGRLHTYYIGLGFSGPLFAGFSWKGYGYFGTGEMLSYMDGSYTNALIVSGMGALELTWFSKKALYSLAKLSFTYSSGDADSTTFFEGNTAGLATQFIPISRPAVGVVFSPQLSNIFYPKLSYSIKPFSMIKGLVWQNTQLEVAGIGCFRSTTGPISETGVDGSSTSLYLGTEIDATFTMRITSEIGLSYTQGVFIPNATVFTEKPVSWVGKFLLSLTI